MVDEEAQAEATRKRSEAELLHAQDDLTRVESAHQAAHLNYQRLADVVKVRPNWSRSRKSTTHWPRIAKPKRK